jgi:hypothetical protein
MDEESVAPSGRSRYIPKRRRCWACETRWIKVETVGGSGSCQLKAKVTGDTLPDVLTTSTWSRFDATARHHILLLPCIKLADRVKNNLTDFDEGWSPPPGPERLQVPEAPLRYSTGVQLRYRRKTLFR